jgi:hypothetical protein
MAGVLGTNPIIPLFAHSVEISLARHDSPSCRPKRRELQEQQPEAWQSAKLLAIVPRTAELYRRHIAKGLDGDPRAALQARVFLRHWLNGKFASGRCRMAS